MLLAPVSIQKKGLLNCQVRRRKHEAAVWRRVRAWQIGEVPRCTPVGRRRRLLEQDGTCGQQLLPLFRHVLTDKLADKQ